MLQQACHEEILNHVQNDIFWVQHDNFTDFAHSVTARFAGMTINKMT
jgi:hypothetical protein